MLELSASMAGNPSFSPFMGHTIQDKRLKIGLIKMAKSGGGTGRGGRKLDPIDAAFIASLNARKSISEEIRPDGKAPRGKGREYAARRQIANILDNLQRLLADNQSYLSKYRGQRSQSRRATIAQQRVLQLRQAVATIQSIATAGGSWAFRLELIKDVRDASKASLVRA